MAENTPSKIENTFNKMFGRRQIYSDTDDITRYNIREVLNKVLPAFTSNKIEAEYLYNYYRGDQPILRRVKIVRPEINNKVVENHAFEIVSFKTPYFCGEPITYVRRAVNKNADDTDKSEGDDISRLITRLNEIMHISDKSAVDKDIVDWLHICGTSYRYCVENENGGLKIGSLDPRNTGVVYSRRLGNEPVMSIQEIITENKPPVYDIYTKTTHFTVYNDNIEEQPHIYGAIPIIEYPANNARLGAFEAALPLLDTINTIASNRVDGIEQFVQSFLRCINIKIDEELLNKLNQEGLIQFFSDKDNPASVDYIGQELNQSQIQVAIDHIYQQILIICGMPDRNGASRTTGDTGQAVILRDGWTAAESYAKDTEGAFKRSEKRFLEIALNILKNQGIMNLNLNDIEIKFTRNNTDNIITKTQALQSMLNARVHPQIAFKLCSLFSDPEQAYLDSKPYLNAEAIPQTKAVIPNG